MNNNQSSNLQEGLIEKALEHLVLPMISCDEYESKIDDRRVIVVGFFVNDLNPAEDLSMFIDKSSSEILDTEVSPSPTPEGYYMVFVEIARDEKFPAIVMDMLGQIENLCSISEWEMKCLGQDELLPVNKKTMKENLILDEKELPEIPDEEEQDDELDNDTNEPTNKEEPKTDEPNPETNTEDKPDNEGGDELSAADAAGDEDKLEEFRFWKNSEADKIEITETNINLIKYGKKYSYKIINDAPLGSIKLFEDRNVSTLQTLLGPNYSVWNFNDELVVEYGEQFRMLKSV